MARSLIACRFASQLYGTERVCCCASNGVGDAGAGVTRWSVLAYCRLQSHPPVQRVPPTGALRRRGGGRVKQTPGLEMSSRSHDDDLNQFPVFDAAQSLLSLWLDKEDYI